MVDLNNSKQSDVGEDSPTDASKKAIDDIVDDVIDSANIEKPEEEKEEVTEPIKEEESQTEPEEEEEDLIPRSKVQERMDALTAQVKKLESENQKLTSKKPETKEEKLNQLSLEELRSLRKQTKLAQRTEQDDARFSELLELEESLEDKIREYPQRFRETQVKNLNAVIQDFAKIDPNVVHQRGDLWNIASNIYSRVSSLQSSPMGQVEAMLLAADHLSMKNTAKTSKETGDTLQRQVNNLKNKTSLAGKTRVSQEKGINLQKLREKANSGSMADKENFIREALVPEDFLQI